MADTSWTARIAPVYEWLNAPFERHWFTRWRRAQWAQVPAHGPGLEVGVGTGLNFRFHPRAARRVGIDVAQSMLAEAQRKSNPFAPALAAADVQALPFRNGAFQWVAATFVFCEVSDPASGLTEVRRVLRPDGTLVLLEHVRPEGTLGRAAEVLTRLTGPLCGEHFDRDTERAAQMAGFETVSRDWLFDRAITLLVARPGKLRSTTGQRQDPSSPSG